ncbi:MAG: hypothetical protein A2751_01630 [Candidatus Doudnabacteria bacterium RIFCSPHIGHO2_01_FULL_46_14]|uniref:Uncharacterized protein n=1 Tax=Candidatus Doudnabacteria bacterium RIFCSPHIGHO2_01_FULL_46_14 TaxID=1817824 RepID=A0A1F5NK12_9BACT|nr:MAG: hypothetical protein A2751_01630 [Candidatus Doudnabacteria bacterium RIFCSPHIGHO2_01_FULL_46_14]
MRKTIAFVRQNLLGQVIASLLFLLLAFTIAKAVTTLNLNIATDGTLSVTGATSLSADLYSTDGALFNVSSTTAFLLQNGSGTNIFAFDTTSSGSGFTLTATTSITTGGSGSRGLLITGAASQAQNLLQINNSSNAFLSGFTGAGGLLMNISSTTAFILQNAGTNHFVIDSSGATASTTQRGGLVVDTDTFVVNANENEIGIGTAVPYGALDIRGATASSTALVIGGDVDVYRSAANALTIDSALSVTGNLTLQNSEVIGNTTATNVFISGTSIGIATTTASTTAGSLWVAAPAGVSTTTVQIGGNRAGETGSATPGSCIQMWRENVAYKVYIDTAGTGLKVIAGTCRD